MAQDDLVLILFFIRNIPNKLQSLQMGKPRPGCCTCGKSHPLVAKHRVMVHGQAQGLRLSCEEKERKIPIEGKYFWESL